MKDMKLKEYITCSLFAILTVLIFGEEIKYFESVTGRDYLFEVFFITSFSFFGLSLMLSIILTVSQAVKELNK